MATRKKTDTVSPGLQKLVSQVQILAIRAEQLGAVRLVPDDAIPETLLLGGSDEASAEVLAEKEELVVRIKFGFWAKGPDKKTEIARAGAVFILRYRVPADVLQMLNEEVVAEFARRNGVYNAWPYWREYLQNAMMRLSIPGIVVPVYRIAPASKQPLSRRSSTAESRPRRKAPSAEKGRTKTTKTKKKTARKTTGKATSRKNRSRS